jgi:hypothetical protein
MKYGYINKRFLFYFYLMVSFCSCVEPFQPNLRVEDTKPLLVVDGLLTDETGPFRVHLSTSGPVDKMYSSQPYKGAEVMITDNKGNTWQLYDNLNGWYETSENDLKGIPGTSYTLKINDTEGNHFESTPELLQDVPEIDSVYCKEFQKARFENGSVYEDNWLNILLDSHDPTGTTKYWLWRFEETWEIRMLTYVRVRHGETGSPGVFYSDETVEIDDEKEICWVSMPSTSVLIKSTLNALDTDIKEFQIQSLGPGEDKLYIRYSILVKQYALNQESYDFWKKLKVFNEEAGGIFSKIPAPTFGNITCTSGDKKALGYFSASAVKTKRIFINPVDHHINTESPYEGCVYLTDPNPAIYFRWVYFTTIANTDTKLWVYDDDICTDCRAYGTNVKPDFW